MEDKDLLDLVERVARVESYNERNANDIAEIKQKSVSDMVEVKQELREVKEQQKAIYEISTNMKLMIQSLNSVKGDIVDIKKGQDNLTSSIDNRFECFDARVRSTEKRIEDVNNKSVIKIDITKLLNKFVRSLGRNWYKWLVGIAGAMGIATQYNSALDLVMSLFK